MRVLLATVAVLPPLMPALALDVPAGSRIDQVLVFPQGAEVSRMAKVRLEAGQHVVIINDLPAQLAPASIRVEGNATGRLELGAIDSRRLFVPRADAAVATSERRRLEDELERLKDQRAVVQADVQAAEAQKAFVGNLAQLPTNSRQGAAGAPREDWGQLVGLIGSAMADAQKRLLDAQVRLRAADRAIEEVQKKLTAVAPVQEERTEVKILVTAGAPIDAELTVRYQVAAASWTPLYDARLSTGTKNTPAKLTLTRRASISQRTGEAWDNVTLTLSSARPAFGSSAPELSPVTIDFEQERPKPAPPPPAAPLAAGRAAPGAMQDSAEGGDQLKARKAAADVVLQEATNSRANIDTAGFQVTFAPSGRQSVPNTGEVKRLLLDEESVEPSLAIRTVPKIDAKGYLYAKMQMPRRSPYLPGPVALFRDQTFVGNGRLPALTAGEEHELGFGADDAVRVRFAIVDEKRGETGLISSSRTDQRSFKVTVKNTHERPIALTVIDQVPVALNQEIRVETTGRSQPSRKDLDDRRGVLAWDDKLGPDEEKSYDFGYRITWPAAKTLSYGR